MLIDKPREISLNSVPFSETEIRFLKELFKGLDMVRISKEDVRKSGELSKALSSGAVANMKMATEELVELNLTQAGRALLGKV